MLNKDKLAKTGEEYLLLLSSTEDWIIRSLNDLNKIRHDAPFLNLSDKDFNDFSESLIFKNGGLAHANYGSLMNSLSLSEIFSVFEHFGMSPSLFVIYLDKICDKTVIPNKCKGSPRDICSDACK